MSIDMINQVNTYPVPIQAMVPIIIKIISSPSANLYLKGKSI
jgi:hypothetical protein